MPRAVLRPSSTATERSCSTSSMRGPGSEPTGSHGSGLVTAQRLAHDPVMVEYGQGVGQATGAAGGGGGGGQTMDAGAAMGQFVGNAVHTISTMPPTELALLVVIIVIGLVIFKRAF